MRKIVVHPLFPLLLVAGVVLFHAIDHYLIGLHWGKINTLLMIMNTILHLIVGALFVFLMKNNREQWRSVMAIAVIIMLLTFQRFLFSSVFPEATASQALVHTMMFIVVGMVFWWLTGLRQEQKNPITR